MILDMASDSKSRRYIVTSSLIGWIHTHDDPCLCVMYLPIRALSVKSSSAKAPVKLGMDE